MQHDTSRIRQADPAPVAVAIPMALCLGVIGAVYLSFPQFWKFDGVVAIHLESILITGALIGIFGLVLFAAIATYFPQWNQSWTERSGYVALGVIVIGSSCVSGVCVPSMIVGGVLRALPLLPLFIGGKVGTHIGYSSAGPVGLPITIVRAFSTPQNSAYREGDPVTLRWA